MMPIRDGLQPHPQRPRRGVLVGIDSDDHSTLAAGLRHLVVFVNDSSQKSRDGNWPAGWTGL